jgi:hypothetical protein
MFLYTPVIYSLLRGSKHMPFLIMEGIGNAVQETHTGRDRRQAALAKYWRFVGRCKSVDGARYEYCQAVERKPVDLTISAFEFNELDLAGDLLLDRQPFGSHH